MDRDTENMLAGAMYEIRDLRRRNEILGAKVEMIDLFACVLNTQPAHLSRGASIDIAWQIEKRLAEIKAERELKPSIT